MRHSPSEGLRPTFTHLALALLTNLLPRLFKWNNQGTQLLNTVNTSIKVCFIFLLILEHYTHLIDFVAAAIASFRSLNGSAPY